MNLREALGKISASAQKVFLGMEETLRAELHRSSLSVPPRKEECDEESPGMDSNRVKVTLVNLLIGKSTYNVDKEPYFVELLTIRPETVENGVLEL